MGLAGSGNTWGNYATAGLIMAATIVAFAGTAAGNFAYGLTQGTDSPFIGPITTKQIACAVMLSLDFGAAGFAVAMGRFYQKRLLLPLLLAAGPCALFSFIALTNTMGFMGMETANAAALRAHKAVGYDALAEDLAEQKRQLGSVTKARPASVVLAIIAEKEGDALYLRSKQCASITTPESRELCDAVRKLRTEAAAADTAARLNRDIQAVQARLNGTQPVVFADSLAVSAENLFGIKQDSTNRYRPFLVAFGAWLLSTFGLAAADMVLASGRVQPSSATLPTIEVVRPPYVQAPSLIEPPLSSDPLPLESPLPQSPVPEKAKETAIGQDLDAPGRALVPVEAGRADADTWVERWAWGLKPGVYAIADLKTEYGVFVDKKGCPKIHKQQLGAALRRLGFEEFRDRGNGKKISFRFPRNSRIVAGEVCRPAREGVDRNARIA